jgi:hypothetical protein
MGVYTDWEMEVWKRRNGGELFLGRRTIYNRMIVVAKP